MDKYCQHQKICNGSGKSEYYLFTWSIPEISLIFNLNVSSASFKMLNGCTYYASLKGSEDEITFRIVSGSQVLKCSVSMIIGNKTQLLSNSLVTYSRMDTCWFSYDLVTLSSKDESFQKLKQNPNNTLAFICKIVYSPTFVATESLKTISNTSTHPLNNTRSLAAVLRDSPESSLKEKVLLKVGEETESVSKAVLCAKSPVFAKMFENDMREGHENEVNITDIKMPVLKVLVEFLYFGELSSRDLDLLCDLYYAADKYDISDLRQICVDLLITMISNISSMQNIYRVMKLAFSHNDELLKSAVMALLAINFGTWFSKREWKNFIDEEPKIALEVLNFFDI